MQRSQRSWTATNNAPAAAAQPLEIKLQVIARADGAEELPLNGNRDLVIETRVQSIGELANIAPGMTGTVIVTLKPGAYVLFCTESGRVATLIFINLRGELPPN